MGIHKQGLQGRLVLVVNFEINFCFVVAILDLVHNVDTSSSFNANCKHVEIFSELSVS